MPTNVVKTPEDEKKWQKAKEVAEEAGQADNYAYIMGAYKKMNPERFKSAAMPIYNSPPHIVADEEIVAAGKWQGVDEKLMDRAAQILQYHNERDAIKHLIKEGVSKQDAYFAVKAGKLLNKSRMQRRRVADCYIAARRKGKSLEELGTWPLSTVTIYRAVPANVTHFKKMDYVTRSEKWAKEHADHVAAVEEEPAVVLKASVKTSNVYEASNPGEWFYDGPPIKGRVTYRQKYGAAYPGNMGVMEMFQFQSQASTTELRLMERLLKRNKVKEAWELLKKVTGVKLHDPVARVAHRYAFNKYNAPELMSQLMGVLDKEGLDDAYNQIKMKKIPQLVNKAWKDRDRRASKVAAKFMGLD